MGQLRMPRLDGSHLILVLRHLDGAHIDLWVKREGRGAGTLVIGVGLKGHADGGARGDHLIAARHRRRRGVIACGAIAGESGVSDGCATTPNAAASDVKLHEVVVDGARDVLANVAAAREEHVSLGPAAVLLVPPAAPFRGLLGGGCLRPSRSSWTR